MSMGTEILPDQNHIDQIRERLWCGREIGQAAIMIGAGFSRNAEKISPSISAFPLWGQLAEKIYNRLYSRSNILDSNHKIVATAGLGALRLASEYEILFGRQSLDDLLIEIIPDRQYLPGKLHKLLLSLPWSDVFTTNYDTLLERTTPFIHERKYDIVLTHSDIPGRMKPRIVKLHGSFPSHRPFIFTEEDYRTYPKKFAPFVNIVQQSIMENAFCLIGFSGEDPNFINWIGWVRDNLGESTPPIYLCGLLALSNSQRQLLTSRKIIPVDLSPLFPKSDYPDANVRHARSLEWFLLNLMQGQPPNKLIWPQPLKSSSLAIWESSNDLPELPIDDSPEFILGEIHPNLFDRYDFGTLKAEELKKLARNWSKCRENYPGWVVCPKNNRKILWLYTKEWIEPVLDSIEALSEYESLLLIYELNWRLEACLMPLFLNWTEKIERIIKKINPFPKFLLIEGATVTPITKDYQKLNWADIREKWIHLTFAIIREAREDLDNARFYLWINYLKPVVQQNMRWQARWFYEQCLFHLFQFNKEQVSSLIDEWSINPDLEFWEVKRASIFAELGDLKEAKRIAEAALTGIRSRLRPYNIDYALLSQEAWTMFLLEIIQTNEFGRESKGEQNRDRWEKLQLYRCSPRTELEHLTAIVDRPPPKPKPDREVKKGFDPDRVSISYNFSSGFSPSNIRPAFEFLRLFEEGGVPIKCGIVNMHNDEVLSSAKWVLPYAPLWAMCSIIRTNNKKKIEEIFDRVFVATLSQQNVNYLNSIFLTALMQTGNSLSGNGRYDNSSKGLLVDRFNLFSELLSRLCFRLSSSQLEEVLSIAINLSQSSIARYSIVDSINLLFKRVVDVLPQEFILRNINDLLLLDISFKNNLSSNQIQEIIEPFQGINWEDNTYLVQDFDRSTWSLPIKTLIEIVRNGSTIARKHAAFRLSKLNQISALNLEEKNLFASALWSKVDPETGFPSETMFYKFAFLGLPELEVGQAKASFRRYLLSQEFPSILFCSDTPDGNQGWSTDARAIHYIQEWLNGSVVLFAQNDETQQKLCDWTADEVKQLFDKIINYWNLEKEEIKKKLLEYALFAHDLENYFFYLKKLLSQVILPRISEPDDELIILIKSFVGELEDFGISTFSLLPAILFLELENSDDVAQKLRFGLNSTEQDKITDSLQGLYYWFFYSDRESLPPPPNDLLNELVNRVLIRRQPGLDSVMRLIVAIFKNLHQLFTESQIETLCTALQYLVKETELPTQRERDLIDGVNIIIAVSDRPQYRQLAAEIAYQLHQHYLKTPEKALPNILSVWREICQNDPFSEVRKVWK